MEQISKRNRAYDYVGGPVDDPYERVGASVRNNQYDYSTNFMQNAFGGATAHTTQMYDAATYALQRLIACRVRRR
jgi:hypothetical protein